MPMVGSKPSISASSWLSVCSRSSLETTAPEPARRWPIASTSSMKMIAGDRLRASANRSRTRAAPTPTNISTKLGAGHREEGHVRLARHGAREQRLAGSRRADHEHAARHHGPCPRVAVGVAQEVDDLADLRLRAVVAGDVGERGGGLLLVEHLGPGPADAEDALHLARRAAGQPPPEPEQDDERREDDDPVQQLGAEPGRERADGGLARPSAVELALQCLSGLRREDHACSWSCSVSVPLLVPPGWRDGDRRRPCARRRRTGTASRSGWSAGACAPPGRRSRGTSATRMPTGSSQCRQRGRRAAARSRVPACRPVAGVWLACSCGPALSARRAPFRGAMSCAVHCHYACPQAKLPGGLMSYSTRRICRVFRYLQTPGKLTANVRKA